MGRETFHSSIIVAEEDDVKAFVQKHREGPALEPMYPHLTGKTIRSKWNTRLKDLFVTNFMHIGWGRPEQTSDITAIFFTYLAHLRNCYRIQLLVAQNGGVATQAMLDDAKYAAQLNRRRYVGISL